MGDAFSVPFILSGLGRLESGAGMDGRGMKIQLRTY